MQIGIDIGGSHIGVGILNSQGKILAKKEKNIQIEGEIQCYLKDNIVSLVNELLKECGIPLCLIERIGIAVPGRVENNIIEYCHNLKLTRYELAKELEKYFGIEIKISNDAKCAAMAEKEYGSLKEYSKNSVFLCLGTGIGGATFINGKLLGQNDSEYGHMIIKKDGLECNCGNKGCFETYCSMRAFKSRVIEILNLDKEITSEEILDRINKNIENEELNKYINEYIDDLLLGISNICNMLEPEVICFGGSFVYFEKILFSRLIEKLAIHKYKFNVPKIVLAKLENDAGIIGSTISIENSHWGRFCLSKLSLMGILLFP